MLPKMHLYKKQQKYNNYIVLNNAKIVLIATKHEYGGLKIDPQD